MGLSSRPRRPLAERMFEKLTDAIAEQKSRSRQRRPRRTADGARRLNGLPARDLMYCFESLGDNCEFGLVQRRCGAEPLGLFRFATIEAEGLAGALEAGLGDILDPATLEAQLSGGRHVAHSRAYGATFGHSGLYEGDLPPERALVLIRQRLQFLARKLREILGEGEKILVYRSRSTDDVATALRVGEALRRFGPNMLLWVEGTERSQTAGSVEWIAEGVLRGYIEADSDWDAIRFDTWMRLCEQVHALWHPAVAQQADRSSLRPLAKVPGR
jgi:hypothetical protein